MNEAAFLDHVGQKALRVGPTEMYEPGPDEVLIKTHAWGIAPADWKVQDWEMPGMRFPAVMGCDIAGDIESVGPNVAAFKKGDRVMGHCIYLLTKEQKHGAFNLYTVVPVNKTAKIPDSMSYTDGAVLPLAIDTAVACLCQPSPEFLGLPLPSTSPENLNKTILVWGGASSVGMATIQIAIACGVRVITTASPKNFELCKSVGASEVFDYRSASVIDDIVAAFKKDGAFGGVVDCISSEDGSYCKVLPIVEQLGGGTVACVSPVPSKVPKGVTAAFAWATHPVTDPLWQGFYPRALEAGVLRPLPRAEVVGKGLAEIQKAIDLSRKGVSAIKLIVEA